MATNHLDEEAVFDIARQIPLAEVRRRYVRQVCGDNEALMARVEALLRVHEEEPEFLQNASLPSSAATREAPGISEQAGERIGRYKLLQKIGEGGFGVVFMAEQEEPVRRSVAVKVIKPGMDSREVVARFEVERQTLAIMNHPNIAQVFDGGVTANGRPFFVMELVKGVPITTYCDKNELTTEERLTLFVDVCHAVQHAHHKGVIHRDLKPSNIMVTLHDGKPVVKIIDFGVSKAINQRLTEKTLFTAYGQMVGTPQYMSPEQAEMSGLDVDTRSDLYSLGVVLYELLTGTTPLDAERVRRAGYAEIQRIIQEEEPPKPSVRLSTVGEQLTVIAKHRRVEPQHLRQLVRGDLDWIVMKSLSKERNHRYDSARDFAEDIRRHLQHQPISARPPSALYRLQKFARRNKTLLAILVLVGTVLVVAVVVSLTLAVWANEAEHRAESLLVAERQARRREAEQRIAAEISSRKAKEEADKANLLNDLLQQMLVSSNPDSGKGRDYTVRELLDDFSVALVFQSSGELAAQPEVEATIRSLIGQAYTRLGELDQAEPHLEVALDLRRRVHGVRDKRYAESLFHLAWFQFGRGDLEEAERYARESAEILRGDPECVGQTLDSLRALHFSLIKQGKQGQAEVVAQDALRYAKKNDCMKHPAVAMIILNTAEVELARGHVAKAHALLDEGLAIHSQVYGEYHPERGWLMGGLAEFYRKSGEFLRAAQHYRKALTIFTRYYDASHDSVRGVLLGWRSLLEEQGNVAELDRFREEYGELLQQVEEEGNGSE
jgi:serine/threonine protein kinase